MNIYYLKGYKDYAREKKRRSMDIVIDSGVPGQEKIRV